MSVKFFEGPVKPRAIFNVVTVDVGGGHGPRQRGDRDDGRTING